MSVVTLGGLCPGVGAVSFPSVATMAESLSLDMFVVFRLLDTTLESRVYSNRNIHGRTILP
jgi:hypothetical protein